MTNTIRNSKEGLNVVTYVGNGGGQFVGPNANFGGLSTYPIDKSLRFRAAQSTRLDISFGAPNDQNHYTFSCWLKKTVNGVLQNFFGVGTNNSLGFNSSDQLVLTLAGVAQATSTVVFKDNSRWMHVQYYQSGTGIGIYVDNQLVASGTAASTVFNTAVTHQLGCANTSNYFDGYMAYPWFSDGQTLVPTASAYQDTTSNLWRSYSSSLIRTYVGFGANGFFYMFNDTPSTVQVYDRKTGDSATGGRNATCTNVGISGVDTDWTNCSPTSNHPTVDSIPALSLFTLSRGATSLVHNATDSADGTVLTCRIPSSGKYYLEITCPSGSAGSISAHVGILSDGVASNIDPVTTTGFWGFRIDSTMRLSVNGNETTTSYTVPVNAVFQLAIDCDNKKLYLGTDNTWRTPSNITGAAFNEANYAYYGDLTGKRICLGGIRAVTFDVNTGQRSFSFTPPTGFVAPNSQNLPQVNISTKEVGLAIIKNRDATQEWVWADQVRGMDKWLSSSSVSAEASDYNTINPNVTKRGCVYVGNNAKVNTLNQKYVAYLFNASRTVTNIINWTQTLTNGVWTKLLCSIGAAVADPIGGTTAYPVVEDATTGQRLCYNVTASLTAGTTYTASAYLKAGVTRTWSYIEVKSDAAAYPYAFFDLANGVIGVTSGCTAIMTPVGNGWYRCSVTYTMVTSTTSFIGFSPSTGNNVISYLGNGSGSIYAWGAQLEAGATLSDYIRNDSILATVRANKRTGFSTISWTGNLTNSVLGHGLATSPKFVIAKNRATGTYNWHVWHVGLTSGGYFLKLSATDAQTLDATCWNSTVPDSQVISLGSALQTNNSGLMVAYAWAEIPGYSKFGSYIGTAPSEGIYVHCGFRPRLLIVKNITSALVWGVFDSERSPYNVVELYSSTESNGVEAGATIPRFDFTSTGFKVRDTGSWNTSGNTIVYCAFAEMPSGDFFTSPATVR